MSRDIPYAARACVRVYHWGFPWAQKTMISPYILHFSQLQSVFTFGNSPIAEGITPFKASQGAKKNVFKSIVSNGV